MEGDARALHALRENRGAVFQAASQFNLLETVGPDVTPEDGVSRYIHDRTQGPACAIAAGAGTKFERCGPEETTFSFDHPVYVQIVNDFIDVAANGGFTVADYQNAGGPRINKSSAISTSSLEPCRAMITFALRGEHFVPGWIGAAIEDGRIQLLLQRLETFEDGKGD